MKIYKYTIFGIAGTLFVTILTHSNCHLVFLSHSPVYFKMAATTAFLQNGALSHALRHPNVKVPHGRGGVGLTDPAGEEGGEVGGGGLLLGAGGHTPAPDRAAAGAAANSNGKSVDGGRGKSTKGWAVLEKMFKLIQNVISI